MNNGDTRTDLDSGLRRASAGHAWVLTIAYHANERAIGRRLAFSPGQVVQLGRRTTELGPSSFEDAKVSRRHASVTHSGQALVIEDAGSRNGTWVNGLRIAQSCLEDGDLITIGGVLLLAQRGPRLHRPLTHPEIVGAGPATSSLLHGLQIAAGKSVTVLIVGETGVGKELVARAIHRASGRPGQLVAVNCSALSDGVLQSELFGHLAGAFSGAAGTRQGLVAAAAGGTLLLDEIGDASGPLQASLLRLLEQREYRAVGSDAVRTTNARFIAATHVDLPGAIAAGRFRADLYSRLDRWRIEVPPLRAHQEDIILLALHFARRCRPSRPVAIARSFAHALLRYPWPANVRELQSVIEQACIESTATELRLSDALAQRLDAAPAPPSIGPPPARQRSGRGVRRERPDAAALRALFHETGGNVRALSEQLAVGRTTIYRWFREAGIDVEQLRDS